MQLLKLAFRVPSVDMAVRRRRGWPLSTLVLVLHVLVMTLAYQLFITGVINELKPTSQTNQRLPLLLNGGLLHRIQFPLLLPQLRPTPVVG